jgi:hypothetical protein
VRDVRKLIELKIRGKRRLWLVCCDLPWTDNAVIYEVDHLRPLLNAAVRFAEDLRIRAATQDEPSESHSTQLPDWSKAPSPSLSSASGLMERCEEARRTVRALET